MHIEGMVVNIQYRNDKNGYTVATIMTKNEDIDCVGTMPFINEGDNVKINGEWVKHNKYGDQIAVSICERILPDTPKAIEEYLASGVLKGIGPAFAKKIVKEFGTETLNILKNDFLKLTKIKGINIDKALKIGKEYIEKISLEEFLRFMQEFNIPINKIIGIYDVYGEKSLSKVKGNPYSIALGDFGISFHDADKIAAKVGSVEQLGGEHRIMAAIEYCLNAAVLNGHTYYPTTAVIKNVKKLIDVDEKDIINAFASLEKYLKIIMVPNDEGERIYLTEYFNAEQEVAGRLMHLSSNNYSPLDNKDIVSMLNLIEVNEGVTFGQTQRDAIGSSLHNGVFVITGGPGTGKTTIIKSIIYLYENLGLKVKLAAPTGRAAKRMSEATGQAAETVHRLLELVYAEENEQPIFLRNEENPIKADVIIIDEMSMVDIQLMKNLLRAIEDDTKLILVGDSNQLPSVGAGNVLRDILKSCCVKCVVLNEVFRQAEQSMIVVNSHKINNGEFPEINIKEKDFFFIDVDGVESIANTVVDLCARRLPNTYNIDPMLDIQVLTPTRKGVAGVGNLNYLLKNALNPSQSQMQNKEWNGYQFSLGDRVMQIKNNYQREWEGRQASSFKIIAGKGVFNGDMGTLAEIDNKANRVLVSFDDDKTAWYNFDSLDELEPAYAITVHKSQGCEFPYVVMPIAKFHNVLMTRNLLYTAVTRAVKMVVLVGEKESLAYMIKNNRELARYSSLIEALNEYARNI